MKKGITVLFLLLGSFTSCELPFFFEGECEILMKNSAPYEIACYIADGVNSGFSYPDTLLPPSVHSFNTFRLTEHILDSAYVYHARGNYRILVSGTQRNVVSFYIFSQEEIQQLGWPVILAKNQYLVRYDLTADDLVSIKGTLHYPPDESMASIHRFP